MAKSARLFTCLFPILVLAAIQAPGSHAEDLSKNTLPGGVSAPEETRPVGDPSADLFVLPDDESPLAGIGSPSRRKNPKGTLVPSSSRGLVSACSQSTSDFDIFCDGLDNSPDGWCCGSLEPCLEFCMALCDTDFCVFVE